MHRLARTAVVAGLTGLVSVSAAWAGIGVAPVPLPVPVGSAASTASAPVGGTPAAPSGETGQQGSSNPPVPAAGQVLAGAAKTNLLPRPDDMRTQGFPTARWERDMAKCKTLDPGVVQQLAANTNQTIDHLATAGSPWPENPNCLYMGGYGIGPMNPITSFDQQVGLWVRAFAISDGKDLVVVSVIDAEGYLWDYKSKCSDCGVKQIGQALAADPDLQARGFRPESFNLHATHSHTALDLIGGWGYVPDWYMKQVTESIKSTVKQAVMQLQPAVLETGRAQARGENSERRGTYRSAEESELTWLRAVAPGRNGRTGATIATLGAFAAHPVTQDAGSGVAHADWPGWFASAAEQRFGGVGMHVMTGLGNLTGAHGQRKGDAGKPMPGSSTGDDLVALIPPVGAGTRVTTGNGGATDVRQKATTWQQPVTNVPLDALGTPGFFDRRFDTQPARVSVGKSDKAPCVSAAPQSVELPARAIRIGDQVVMTTGPGEEFANLTNTIKEKNPDAFVFPMAQTNDSLGYMPQSFELNPVGQQGLGFAIGGVAFVNYEDSYAIDRCVGDMALETTLGLLRDLK